jgi:hypothetical protein
MRTVRRRLRRAAARACKPVPTPKPMPWPMTNSICGSTSGYVDRQIGPSSQLPNPLGAATSSMKPHANPATLSLDPPANSGSSFPA